MRAVIQRVTRADVKIAGQVVGEIGPGLLVLLGVAALDRREDADWLAKKIIALRLFPDASSGFAQPIGADPTRSILVVSQFTLLATVHKGTRPSFHGAAAPALAEPLYEYFLRALEVNFGRAISRGAFGAEMQVSLVNDGPVTLVVDAPSANQSTAAAAPLDQSS